MWDPARDQHELDNRRRLARDVLRSLDGVPTWTLRMLASAVAMSAPPIDKFASAFDAQANTVEGGHEGVLAEFQMAVALGSVARHPEVLDRLEGLEVAPWCQIRSALVEVRESERW